MVASRDFDLKVVQGARRLGVESTVPKTSAAIAGGRDGVAVPTSLSVFRFSRVFLLNDIRSITMDWT